MKRMHIHVSVENLTESIRFYSAMFGGIEPTVRKPDYCKWELSDPAVNFAISQRLARSGIDHFGIQVETEEELIEMRNRFALAEIAAEEETTAQCCYAVSDKSWTVDPQGVAWETFRTLEAAPAFGKSRHDSDPTDAAAANPDIGADANTDADPSSPNAPCCGPQQSAVTIAFRRRR
ncbi:ArsI/CadI family heavy metal resistance metalloenzyme [Paraburkholderia sp. SARCC-3016]|uniref:ArsI/CadI family heavy metal resistance metalloenzyme n=1 Tax=Paraburkholderia sp. SARCC-3016 TaxID=3058611 RepID=UPI002806FA43|nr:ArsI/CadI family heavy metal resistance metalloenzyme [Paraburkholderia sp. SARCC-3016]MDQ7975730.1 ArsI/CadI family heavy metal resistance metalloenzyme [Paraburkholderia sp. SARCC-3016]